MITLSAGTYRQHMLFLRNVPHFGWTLHIFRWRTTLLQEFPGLLIISWSCKLAPSIGNPKHKTDSDVRPSEGFLPLADHPKQSGCWATTLIGTFAYLRSPILGWSFEPPSPTKRTILYLGLAIFALIAAGTPNPIVPRHQMSPIYAYFVRIVLSVYYLVLSNACDDNSVPLGQTLRCVWSQLVVAQIRSSFVVRVETCFLIF